MRPENSLGIGLGVALKSEGAIARHNELFVVLDDESGPVDTIVVFDFAVIQWHFQAESSTARRVQKTRRIPRVELLVSKMRFGNGNLAIDMK